MNILFSNILNEVDNKAQNVVKLLYDNNLVVSTAESCTGGLVSAAITAVGGSSSVFNLGQCTYANDAKIEKLGVSKQTLEQYGAVSAQTALEMARGAMTAGKADIGVSTTGIAGPDGGTAEKPVGTVYIAVVTNAHTYTQLLEIDKDVCVLSGEIEQKDMRRYVRYMTVKRTLELVLGVIGKERLG